MTHNYIKYFYLVLLIFFSLGVSSQSLQKELTWTGIQSQPINGGVVKTLHFDNATNSDRWGLLPVFTQRFDQPAPGLTYEFEIINAEFSPLESDPGISDLELIPQEISFFSETFTFRGKQQIQLNLLPLRKNHTTGQIEKLEKFEIQTRIVPGGNTIFKDGEFEYAENSVLANGEWFKIGVSETGIYKVSWSQLNDMGFNTSGLQSDMIRLFGNGGGMLPQKNSETRTDDLSENAIEVFDGGDGSFDQGDYFLFYGESPHAWTFDEGDDVFYHTSNLYTNHNVYFVSNGPIPGKRVENLPQSTLPAEIIFTDYNDYAVHEDNSKSLIKSGAEWYGEEFNEVTEQDFFFPFPNRDVSREVHIAAAFAARSTSVSSFSVYINQDSVFTDNVSAIPQNSITKFANPSSKDGWFMANDIQDITVTLNFNRKDNAPVGWLNYLQLNVMSHLIFNGHQFGFRNIEARGAGQSSQFRIDGANAAFKVWDVTDPHTAKNVDIEINESMASFVLEMDEFHEFIGFDGSDFKEPQLLGAVPNQNLHAHQAVDFIIVTHPDFADQANRLKELHEEIDGMNVIVVDLFEIYNEFSSGTPDITAIRDFVRMVYQRSGTPSALKYLLLFGDGSYDPLDRADENLSFVPTFQSSQSLWYTSTYVCDDYFGLMDEEEGKDATGNVDLGIGRFAVNSIEEATLMVDKSEKYMRMSPKVQGNWRNSLTFIADDEDNNLHLYQADTILVARIQRQNKSVNINKIYLDSYRQENSASGHTYPEATADINKQVNEGTLIVNYTGHGGELGLAHEKVVQITDILSWDNTDAQPVFITATCEFSRFDNPDLTSAGELVLLNSKGGGVALFTTTRLAFASSNLQLNKRLYDTLFRAYPHEHPRLGDLMMFSKTPSNTNIRNFVLLGNPALKLALPQLNIVTDSLNGLSVEEFIDTLNATSHLEVSGHIESFLNPGEVYSDFNGTIYPVLYDKPTTVTTLGNDPKSYPYNYQVQNSILYQGKATVKEGRFTFSFVLPTDISYRYGAGKLSYYAADSLTDAEGYFTGLTIGGTNQGNSADNSGPEIEIFLNDRKSSIPNQINPNPVIYIELSDQSGINAAGTGIGHDIVMMLNGNSNNSIVLNELFEPAMDDHTTGNIVYQLHNLPNGDHTIELKAWDMLNNSTVKTIGFSVADSIGVDLMEVYNYPNPFSDYTWFTFNHNQFEGNMKVEINIYNFYGQHIRTIGPDKVFTNGYGIEPIYWDATTEGGAKLQPGVYFYSLKVSNEKNHSTERVQKMIITE